MTIISNFKFQISKSRGFTLIELLIVVSIIGVLTSLLTVNFLSVRERSRDAQRKADLRSIQSALEIYRADYGSYPSHTESSGVYSLNATLCSAGSSSFQNQGGSVTYMQKIPCDPNGVTYYNGGNYYYWTNGTVYTLAACLENINDSQISKNSAGQNIDPEGNPIDPNNNQTGCDSAGFNILNNQ